MEEELHNIHYLNPDPATAEASQTSSQEQLFLRLEAHLERMETEFKKTVKQFAKQDGHRSSPASADLSEMVHNLEERLKMVSDEVRQAAAPRQKKSQLIKLVEGGLHLLGTTSTHAVRDFFVKTWFGNAKEESFEFDDFGLDPTFMEKVKPFFDFLYQDYWRVNVKGVHHIPRDGRGLIVSNHSGTLPYDGAMIRVGVLNEHPARRDVRFLVEDFVYHFPFLGTFMYRTGGVRACPENAERLLNKDHLVAVFPEGVKGIGKEFKNRYRLQRFGRGGFIKLALKTRSPIIPTAVIGAEEIHPIIYKSTALAKPLGIPYIPITPTLPWLGPLGLIPLPSKWTIVFAEPIRFDRYGPEDAEDQMLVNKLSEMVRSNIQDHLSEEIKNRRSVWFG